MVRRLRGLPTLAILALGTTVAATIWMFVVDGSQACGLGWDPLSLPGCGWIAILRELITVDGAILGFFAFLLALLSEPSTNETPGDTVLR